jgi:hypothetical protein
VAAIVGAGVVVLEVLAVLVLLALEVAVLVAAAVLVGTWALKALK